MLHEIIRQNFFKLYSRYRPRGHLFSWHFHRGFCQINDNRCSTSVVVLFLFGSKPVNICTSSFIAFHLFFSFIVCFFLGFFYVLRIRTRVRMMGTTKSRIKFRIICSRSWRSGFVTCHKAEGLTAFLKKFRQITSHPDYGATLRALLQQLLNVTDKKWFQSRDHCEWQGSGKS